MSALGCLAGLDGLGLPIPIELASEPAAILAIIRLGMSADHRPTMAECETAGLDALPPRRRAQKVAAMRQRRAREAGR